MNTDGKYEPKKEHREWYFVEYHPANYFKFANIQLILTVEETRETDIIKAMEKEATCWLTLYPIPVMVSVFDNKGDLYKFSKIKEKKHLIAFFDQRGEIYFHWGLLKDEEIPDVGLDQEYRNNLYSDFNFITDTQYGIDREKRRRQIDDGRFIILVWIVLTAFVAEIFVYFNQYLSLIAFLYVLFKAIQKILQFTNILPISKKEKEKIKEQTLKDHYYYHCQMNPEGFNRLKMENFERMRKEEIAQEATSFKK
ncbi:MAG: hypothetical protein UZ14_CFX002001445 [Chloroflexi bacterium OLB14]|nr:MAG: hypothetical protein UZ14_CFX002001445 [Chloroflexi bacterium OLB14]